MNKLGEKWKKLNEEYDYEIMQLIETKNKLTGKLYQKLKRMQEELFQIENEIFEHNINQ